MAIRQDISARDTWFVGEDKVLSCEIRQADGVTPQDIAGWALEWTLRRKPADADPPVLQKTTSAGITITGIYNVNPALNTQRALIAVADDDTAALTTPLKFHHALKRTDAGSETVLLFGTFELLQATTR